MIKVYCERCKSEVFHCHLMRVTPSIPTRDIINGYKDGFYFDNIHVCEACFEGIIRYLQELPA